MSPKTDLSSAELCEKIIALLEDKKADQIVKIDLEDKTSISDYLVIASGLSGRQVGAMADFLYRELKDNGILCLVEGMKECNWVLVDAGDVIVHLFRPEVRSFYNLEKMWGVTLPENTSQSV